jgi:hypothetical protein
MQRRSHTTGARLEFLGLPLKLFGKLHKFASRRIIPRQALRQPQTGFGLIPEIYRVHRCIPARRRSPRLMMESVSGRTRLAVTGITDWTHA